eukprot:Nk52_evm1s67 gene=Nk52_evmTU1s67
MPPAQRKKGGKSANDDPRDMSVAVKWNARLLREGREEDVEDPGSDLSSLMSLVCGVAALTMRVKYLAWCSFILCLISWANQKNVQLDGRQSATSFMFSVMALTMSYMQVPVRKAAEEAS